VKHALWLALLMLPPFSLAENCPANPSKQGSALIQLEQNWAKALEHHDAEAVGCILAPEFQDADPDGQLHSRAETLAAIPNRHPGVNQLSELDPHVYGDFGYIRGLATLVDANGEVKAKVRFTDIYIYRNGRWLAVAGQESLLPKAN
jgi:ketosteroid isomerase-like protein